MGLISQLLIQLVTCFVLPGSQRGCLPASQCFQSILAIGPLETWLQQAERSMALGGIPEGGTSSSCLKQGGCFRSDPSLP